MYVYVLTSRHYKVELSFKLSFKLLFTLSLKAFLKPQHFKIYFKNSFKLSFKPSFDVMSTQNLLGLFLAPIGAQGVTMSVRPSVRPFDDMTALIPDSYQSEPKILRLVNPLEISQSPFEHNIPDAWILTHHKSFIFSSLLMKNCKQTALQR